MSTTYCYRYCIVHCAPRALTRLSLSRTVSRTVPYMLYRRICSGISCSSFDNIIWTGRATIVDTAKRVDLFNCLARRGEFINLGGTQRNGQRITRKDKRSYHHPRLCTIQSFGEAASCSSFITGFFISLMQTKSSHLRSRRILLRPAGTRPSYH